MESVEHSQNGFNRIKKLEPETANRTFGYLLFQEGSAQRMINLDMSSDETVQEVVARAKENLQTFQHSALLVDQINSAQVAWGAIASSNMYYSHFPNSQMEKQNQVMELDDQIGYPGGDYHYPVSGYGNLSTRRFQRTSDRPTTSKLCYYHIHGFCKHGSSCRYVHASVPGTLPLTLENEGQVYSPLSFQRLDIEMVDLLRSTRGGPPLSIASLPSHYFERFGKPLQADGYMTESQRHGKPGFNLTKLLCRLPSVRVVEKMYGQHIVVLAEDATKYMESRHQKNDPGPIVYGSKQIYLTFPCDSKFTEDDVSNYFSTFGKVGDVRIPCQKSRMFGFVSFAAAETVEIVLARGNPHYVRDARVLAKRYREQSNNPKSYKLNRKILFSRYDYQNYIDMDPEYLSTPGRGEVPMTLLRNQIMEDLDQTLEHETRRLSTLTLHSPTTSSHSYYSHEISQDRFKELYALHEPNMINNINTNSNEKEQESPEELTLPDSMDEFNLPESPFATYYN